MLRLELTELLIIGVWVAVAVVGALLFEAVALTAGRRRA